MQRRAKILALLQNFQVSPQKSTFSCKPPHKHPRQTGNISSQLASGWNPFIDNNDDISGNLNKKTKSQSSAPAGSFSRSNFRFMPFYCCQSLLVADREAEDMNYYRNTNKDVVPRNSYRHRIVTKEMAFYCFDILASHLHRLQEPPWPNFPNDELWV